MQNFLNSKCFYPTLAYTFFLYCVLEGNVLALLGMFMSVFSMLFFCSCKGIIITPRHEENFAKTLKLDQGGASDLIPDTAQGLTPNPRLGRLPEAASWGRSRRSEPRSPQPRRGGSSRPPVPGGER